MDIKSLETKNFSQEIQDWLNEIDQMLGEVVHMGVFDRGEWISESVFYTLPPTDEEPGGWNEETIPQYFEESKGDANWGFEQFMWFAYEVTEDEEEGETEVVLVYG
jgi:hypothetical protein